VAPPLRVKQPVHAAVARARHLAQRTRQDDDLVRVDPPSAQLFHPIPCDIPQPTPHWLGLEVQQRRLDVGRVVRQQMQVESLLETGLMGHHRDGMHMASPIDGHIPQRALDPLAHRIIGAGDPPMLPSRLLKNASVSRFVPLQRANRT